jgi:hypothetical protein
LLSPLDAVTFADALSSDEGLQRPILASGLARKTEHPQIIEFTRDFLGCHGWVKIPVELIEKVLVLGKRESHERTYDFVTIQFQPATSPEAKIFAALLHNQEASGVTDETPTTGRGCKCVRIISFVSGNLIHFERVCEPNLATKVAKVLHDWNVPPNSVQISDC